MSQRTGLCMLKSLPHLQLTLTASHLLVRCDVSASCSGHHACLLPCLPNRDGVLALLSLSKLLLVVDAFPPRWRRNKSPYLGAVWLSLLISRALCFFSDIYCENTRLAGYVWHSLA